MNGEQALEWLLANLAVEDIEEGIREMIRARISDMDFSDICYEIMKYRMAEAFKPENKEELLRDYFELYSAEMLIDEVNKWRDQ